MSTWVSLTRPGGEGVEKHRGEGEWRGEHLAYFRLLNPPREVFNFELITGYCASKKKGSRDSLHAIT